MKNNYSINFIRPFNRIEFFYIIKITGFSCIGKRFKVILCFNKYINYFSIFCFKLNKSFCLFNLRYRMRLTVLILCVIMETLWIKLFFSFFIFIFYLIHQRKAKGIIHEIDHVEIRLIRLLVIMYKGIKLPHIKILIFIPKNWREIYIRRPPSLSELTSVLNII